MTNTAPEEEQCVLLHCVMCHSFSLGKECQWFWDRKLHSQYMSYSLKVREMTCKRCGSVPMPGGWSNISLGWAQASSYGHSRQ